MFGIDIHQMFGMSAKQAHETWWFIALETILLMFCIMLIIELAGRKSVSQLSMIQTVVFIAIGEVVLLPVLENNFHFHSALIVVATLVLFLLGLEYLQMKFNLLERIFVGHAKTLIKDGEIKKNEIEKHRLTIDQLESMLRELGINNINELKTVTFEANGKIGYEFKSEYKPVTVKELRKILDEYLYGYTKAKQEEQTNIFNEVNREGHNKDINDELE